jgi:hypothetical protein
MSKWKRFDAWQHQTFVNSVSLALIAMENIIWSHTATGRTKDLATLIRPLLGELQNSLKDQVNPPEGSKRRFSAVLGAESAELVE